ncbi:MAG: methyltransferase domain-containing protein [Bdellovibrionales bacterium]|nr:methyltransferase domain-containing protein [Bdellovibrionales bacterium]
MTNTDSSREGQSNIQNPSYQHLELLNSQLRNIVKRTKINVEFTYRTEDLVNERILELTLQCNSVLDVGKGSREHYAKFAASQIQTLDIEQYDDYPDIRGDICNPSALLHDSFDGVICLAVLEHVYDPKGAVEAIHSLLRKGGICFAYLPFLYRYHAPGDLKFQDYYRFSRDGIAYLFRDFEDVTLYPIRGRFSTMFNLERYWKKKVERYCGQRINRFVDWVGGKMLGRKDEYLRASGYFVRAVK